MLVTLTDDRFISLTPPGKVQTYMAAGKPILGAATGGIPQMIAAAQCGFYAKPGDAQGLSEAVQKFVNLSSGKRQRLGENAKRYYQENFTQKRFMDIL